MVALALPDAAVRSIAVIDEDEARRTLALLEDISSPHPSD